MSDSVDFEGVRARLAAERASTAAQTVALQREYDGIVEANALIAVDDEHDPEGSNTAFERAHLGAMLGRARQQLVDLELALERLEAGVYARCEVCGGAIPLERLEILPAVRTCVACAGRIH